MSDTIIQQAAITTLITTVDVGTTVIESIGVGPQGIPGIDGIIGSNGLPGVDAVGAIPGNITGDFLRWDATGNAWEVTTEPIVFKGLVLTPALASLIDAEGALYYNLVLKSVLVCTDI